MTRIRFEWDEAKNRANLRKHGISFVDASRVFGDPLRLATLGRIEGDEERWLTYGVIDNSQVLIVAQTIRSFEHDGPEAVRIISARRANRKEKRSYENENG